MVNILADQTPINSVSKNSSSYVDISASQNLIHDSHSYGDGSCNVQLLTCLPCTQSRYVQRCNPKWWLGTTSYDLKVQSIKYTLQTIKCRKDFISAFSYEGVQSSVTTDIEAPTNEVFTSFIDDLVEIDYGRRTLLKVHTLYRQHKEWHWIASSWWQISLNTLVKVLVSHQTRELRTSFCSWVIYHHSR